MILTAQVKLIPDNNQSQLLTSTIITFNDACNYVSVIAFHKKKYHPVGLYNLKIDNTSFYYHLRSKYPNLNATHIQFVFRKVADAYRKQNGLKNTNKKCKLIKPCYFKPMSAIPYDHRISNYKLVMRMIYCTNTPDLNLYVIGGRIKIGYVLGNHQRKILSNSTLAKNCGESRLSYRNGKFYINIPIEQSVSPEIISTDCIGVDLGVSNIAVTSRGRIYSNDAIEQKRIKFQKHRSSLQRCGSKSAKRRLKKISGKEAKFRKNVNHCISKELVAEAKGTESSIALEDLTHIRERTTVRKQQRARHHNWSFRQLRTFVSYKASMAGIVIKFVNPRYTSQRCSICGYIDKSNRKNQFQFQCKSCKHDAHADYNAAVNIAFLGNNSDILKEF